MSIEVRLRESEADFRKALAIPCPTCGAHPLQTCVWIHGMLWAHVETSETVEWGIREVYGHHHDRLAAANPNWKQSAAHISVRHEETLQGATITFSARIGNRSKAFFTAVGEAAIKSFKNILKLVGVG